MTNLDVNKIVGNSFEDLTIDEMTQVQGSGDVQNRTIIVTPVFQTTIFCDSTMA